MSEQERTSQTCLSGPQAGRPSLTAERAQGVQSQGQAEPLRTSEAGSGGPHRWGPRPSPRPSQTSSCGLPSVVPALDTSRHVLVQETAEAGRPPHLLHHLPSQPGHLGAEMKSRSPRESPQGHTNWAARAGVYFQHPGQPPSTLTQALGPWPRGTAILWPGCQSGGSPHHSTEDVLTHQRRWQTGPRRKASRNQNRPRSDGSRQGDRRYVQSCERQPGRGQTEAPRGDRGQNYKRSDACKLKTSGCVSAS